MIDGFPGALTLAAAVGAGLMGGVFFAFSAFVMRALRSLPDGQGLTAMQAINTAAPSPIFLAALLGTALASAGLAVAAILRIDEPAAPYQLVGSALSLAGFALTLGYHVPRNDSLGRVGPSTAGAGEAWRRYARGWTAWNHVRTATSVAAAVALVLALRVG